MVIKKFVSLFKNKAFKITLCAALFLSSMLIILAMLLGQEAGSFVIRVQNGDLNKSIAITEDWEDRSSYSSILRVEGMDNMSDYSPEYFLEQDYQELKTLTEKPGSTLEGNALYIYTFYIVNTGQDAVGVNVSLDYSGVTKELDDLVRVMTYYETYGKVDPDIYQKPDPELVEYDKYIIQPTYFKSGSSVFDNQQINIDFAEGRNYVKYSVLFWLEGNDPDSSDPEVAKKYYGGTIKFNLNIKVNM